MGKDRISEKKNKLKALICILITGVIFMVSATAVPMTYADSSDGTAVTASTSTVKSTQYGKKYKTKKKYPGPSKWKKSIASIENRTSYRPQGRVIFYGSSSIRKWKTLKTDMAALPSLNHGFGGATVNDCVYYADRLIIPYNPRAIVFYAGTNDIAYGYSVTTVYDRTIDFVKYIHQKLPDTPIYYVEQTRQPKRNKYWSKMKKLNSKVKAYAANDPLLTFIDTRKILNTSKDKPRSKYFVKDKLHFSKKGYKAWASAIRPVLYRDILNR